MGLLKKILAFILGLFTRKRTSNIPQPAKEIFPVRTKKRGVVGPRWAAPDKRKHNNRKRTPGRIIQVVEIVKNPSHIANLSILRNGKKVKEKIWIRPKMRTKVIFH
jgi:hypothetical protein